jgi:hypothetical protein
MMKSINKVQIVTRRDIMKMNKALLSALLLTVSGIANAAPAAPEGPGFDIMNKSGGPVTILVNNGYKNIVKAVVKPASTIFGKTLSANDVSASIDINQPTLLVVYEGSFPNNEIEPFRARGGDEGKQAFFFDWTIYGPKTNYNLYHFAPGKKIYVSLHKNGKLDPQKGSGDGKTAVGYSLDNNVTPADIITFDKKYSDYITIRN